MVSIYKPDFNAVCFFKHKTDITEKNFIINSNFMFSSESLRIEETCKYAKMDTNQQFRIVYSIIERSQEERMFIFDNLNEDKIMLLPRNIQDTFREIDKLLEENKDKYVIS
jgi:lipocalin